MTSRIFSSNPKMYDTLGAFRDFPFVYWTQRLKNIEVGEIVYFYQSAPVSKIIYECEVVEKVIPYSE